MSLGIRGVSVLVTRAAGTDFATGEHAAEHQATDMEAPLPRDPLTRAGLTVYRRHLSNDPSASSAAAAFAQSGYAAKAVEDAAISYAG